MTARSPVVVLAPNSFKGSLSAMDAAAAMAAGIRRVWPQAEARLRPMADGGDGTLDAVLSVGGERRAARVAGATGEPVEAPYGLVGSNTAIIESAQVVGLTDARATAQRVERRHTRGLGELISRLLDAGVRKFLVGLGGSSTNDGGAGLLSALGVELLDAAGKPIAPTPAGLASIASVDAHSLDARVPQARFTVLSDVDNPLCGERGATAVFGPQKGVKAESVAEIDSNLARFATLAEAAVGRGAMNRPGAGAAGGLGFALLLIGAEIRSGAEVVADLLGLDAALADADWLITGEGRSDRQTLLGKAPLVAARRAQARGVPATLLSGAIERSDLPELSRIFAGCESIVFGPATIEACIHEAAALIADRAEQLARLFAAAGGGRARP
ncbi:MAG TPA: glycerate kinase [Casimicrobiaceae bacterium]|nr:glycerate kinase [Casimicrobiaceae bacterium]